MCKRLKVHTNIARHYKFCNFCMSQKVCPLSVYLHMFVGTVAFSGVVEESSAAKRKIQICMQRIYNPSSSSRTPELQLVDVLKMRSTSLVVTTTEIPYV